MKPTRFVVLMAPIMFSFAAGVSARDGAAEKCAAFTWDVTHELAVMGRPAKSVAAREVGGKDAGALALDERYSVTLPPEDRARFAVAPARGAKSTAPRGGSIGFTVASSGRYRVSITTRHWIDVVVDGKALESLDHQGNAQCDRLHKVVEFELPADRPLTLQLSGQDDAVVGVVITAAPASSQVLKPSRD